MVLLWEVSCLLLFMPLNFIFPVTIHIQGGPLVQRYQIIIFMAFGVAPVPEEGTFLDIELYVQDDVELV